MLKKIAVSAGLLLALSGSRDALAYEAQLEPFQDVGEKAWYADYVYTLNALGVIDGAGEGIFLPEETLTREAFIKMLVTTAGIEGEEGKPSCPPMRPAAGPPLSGCSAEAGLDRLPGGR
ncbi:S-layer homology domain-containing protein [Paenibacillus sp. CC-CFT747]|nr:S-layer homology domain-containing protein [Paenibacillus sp. CC-CFT747]